MTRDNKGVLFGKLKEHMVKQKLWKVSKEKKVSKRKGSKRRKPIGQRVEGDQVRKKKTQELKTVCSKVSNSALRQKRSKRSKKCKRLTNPTMSDYLGRAKKRQRKKKYDISEEKALVPQLLHPERISFHGLENLGQTCYFNSIVQCLFHCPLFREAIKSVAQPVLSVAVLRELRLLFIQMGKKSSLEFLKTHRSFSAAINIPECKEAHMNKNRQEDACIFFLRLIEHFRKKLKPLADIFEGDLRSTLTCQRCFSSYIKTEPFGLLPLAFPEDKNEHDVLHTHDVYDLLDDFVTPEIISGYNCDRCSTQSPTEKTLDILSTPKVLLLLLKRF